VLGTTLATYSAYRLVKQAVEEDKPVLMINTGPTRADKLESVGRMDKRAGDVLRAYLDELVK
jgi:NAD-dependent deacetylase sirtuin 4